MSVNNDSLDIPDTTINRDDHADSKVGILGAGIAGLYTALIMDSLDIECEILEASGRAGGRISTHKFPGGGKYDYYDMGAMRFPLPQKDSQGRYENGVMKRLAELIDYAPLNEGQDRLKDKLIPYYIEVRKGSSPGCYYYNGTHEPSFGAQGMGVGADYIRVGPEAIISDMAEPFVRMILQDMETGGRKGLEILMDNDLHTVQSYMATKYLPSAHLELPPQHLPNSVINWCGLFGLGNEIPLSTLVFMSTAWLHTSDGDNLQWRCLEGGSEVLPKKIEEYLNKRGDLIRFDKRVTAISQGQVVGEMPNSYSDFRPHVVTEQPRDDYVDLAFQNKITDEPPSPKARREVSCVAVTVNGDETRNYSHVISTLPASVLRTVDLADAGLNVKQRNALRAVVYRSAIKIGILFKSNWWTAKLGIVGGLSVTDLPIRIVVYPSHGVDSGTPSKVLIAAYTTQGDADQLATLASSGHPDALKDVVLRNLAEVHGGRYPDVTYEFLKDQFVDMHIKDWTRDEYSMGAVANFKPGAYQDLYPSLTRPAAGNRLHFAGEAVSYHHGWIVGSLQSAWRAVHDYLAVTRQDEKMAKFKTLWGDNAEWANQFSTVETA